MKTNIYIILIIFLLACDSEDAGDCIKTAGNIVQQQVGVGPFSRILVNEGVKMVLKEAEEYSVVIETGKNLLRDIRVEVKENQLILSNDATCNFFRDYEGTTIYVSAPGITEIRSSTQFDIRSEGILTYPSLRVVSENYGSDYQNVGNFYLHVENNSFGLVFNNLSNCYLKGSTRKMNLFLAAGNSRVEAAGFKADEVEVYHRSSNDVIVNPVEIIKGDIYSTGNIISVNRPPVVEVEEHYKGKLLFKE